MVSAGVRTKSLIARILLFQATLSNLYFALAFVCALYYFKSARGRRIKSRKSHEHHHPIWHLHGQQAFGTV